MSQAGVAASPSLITPPLPQPPPPPRTAAPAAAAVNTAATAASAPSPLTASTTTLFLSQLPSHWKSSDVFSAVLLLLPSLRCDCLVLCPTAALVQFTAEADADEALRVLQETKGAEGAVQACWAVEVEEGKDLRVKAASTAASKRVDKEELQHLCDAVGCTKTAFSLYQEGDDVVISSTDLRVLTAIVNTLVAAAASSSFTLSLQPRSSAIKSPRGSPFLQSLAAASQSSSRPAAPPVSPQLSFTATTPSHQPLSSRPLYRPSSPLCAPAASAAIAPQQPVSSPAPSRPPPSHVVVPRQAPSSPSLPPVSASSSRVGVASSSPSKSPSPPSSSGAGSAVSNAVTTGRDGQRHHSHQQRATAASSSPVDRQQAEHKDLSINGDGQQQQQRGRDRNGNASAVSSVVVSQLPMPPPPRSPLVSASSPPVRSRSPSPPRARPSRPDAAVSLSPRQRSQSDSRRPQAHEQSRTAEQLLRGSSDGDVLADRARKDEPRGRDAEHRGSRRDDRQHLDDGRGKAGAGDAAGAREVGKRSRQEEEDAYASPVKTRRTNGDDADSQRQPEARPQPPASRQSAPSSPAFSASAPLPHLDRAKLLAVGAAQPAARERSPASSEQAAKSGDVSGERKDRGQSDERQGGDEYDRQDSGRDGGERAESKGRHGDSRDDRREERRADSDRGDDDSRSRHSADRDRYHHTSSSSSSSSSFSHHHRPHNDHREHERRHSDRYSNDDRDRDRHREDRGRDSRGSRAEEGPRVRDWRLPPPPPGGVYPHPLSR